MLEQSSPNLVQRFQEHEDPAEPEEHDDPEEPPEHEDRREPDVQDGPEEPEEHEDPDEPPELSRSSKRSLRGLLTLSVASVPYGDCSS